MQGGLAFGVGAIAGEAHSQAAKPAQARRFSYDEVVKRAVSLAASPFDGRLPSIPEEIAKLDFDAWRQIDFKDKTTLLGGNSGQFRLDLFHLGHLFKRPVVINTLRDGIPTPVPYQANQFNFGSVKFSRALPVNLGFAGFIVRAPLNDPRKYDEFISFIGSSYFRFLGRGQQYGLSARGLAVNGGTNQEEFPFYREFWIETPGPDAEKISVYALLDSAAATGAYQFDCYPKENSVVDVKATLVPRGTDAKLGIAPLTSMFFIGENDHRVCDDFRPELHDSDGLMIHTGTGEWIWRPLRNPVVAKTSSFIDKAPKGFGLVQRDRHFDHYEDIDLAYQLRPSYWVEPKSDFGDGHVELFEMPTTDETNDNVVASWVAKSPPAAKAPVNFAYSITSALDLGYLSTNAKTLSTFQTSARMLGSSETNSSTKRRFMIDFAGGDIDYFRDDAKKVSVVASSSAGKILRTSTQYNPYIKGFRATFDIELAQGETAEMRAYLKAEGRTLSETWIFPWEVPKADKT